MCFQHCNIGGVILFRLSVFRPSLRNETVNDKQQAMPDELALIKQT
jgi:hypothetical protein